MLRVRQKLTESKTQKLAKEAKQAEAKSKLMQRFMEEGGPYVTSKDLEKLVNLQKKGRKSTFERLERSG